MRMIIKEQVKSLPHTWVLAFFVWSMAGVIIASGEMGFQDYRITSHLARKPAAFHQNFPVGNRLYRVKLLDAETPGCVMYILPSFLPAYEVYVIRMVL